MFVRDCENFAVLFVAINKLWHIIVISMKKHTILLKWRKRYGKFRIYFKHAW